MHLRLLVELAVVLELAQERLQPSRSGSGTPSAGRASAFPRPARSPRATRCPGARGRPQRCNGGARGNGYGGRRAARAPRRAPRAATSSSNGDVQPGRADLRLEAGELPDRVLDPAGERGIDRRRPPLLRPRAGPARGALRGADRDALRARSAARAGGARRCRGRRARRARGPRSARRGSTHREHVVGQLEQAHAVRDRRLRLPTRSATSPSDSPNSSSSSA